MLEISGVSKQYKNKPVLQNVSCTLAPGQCLGVLGHNGSGKSTLLAVAAQVLAPASGSISCNGKMVLGNRQFMRTQVGYVPQQNALLPDITVHETLVFWQKVYGVAGSLYAPGSPAALMGLQDFCQKKVGALSGGMQKRVSFALALLHSPKWLLLDEVLPALDREYRNRATACIQTFKQQGGGVLYCSHNMQEIQTLCDEVLVLQNGKTVYYGPLASFSQAPEYLDVILNPAP